MKREEYEFMREDDRYLNYLTLKFSLEQGVPEEKRKSLELQIEKIERENPEWDHLAGGGKTEYAYPQDTGGRK